jgi:hypothetical protein
MDAAAPVPFGWARAAALHLTFRRVKNGPLRRVRATSL